MYINEGETNAVGRFRTDNYNRASLVICTVGIFVIGILSIIYTHLGTLSFGI
jgi:NADH-quinone oxidoreductase subunit N